jgi:ceramide glucosyltransferase
MNAAAIVAAIFVGTSLIYYAGATLAVMRFARRSTEPPPPLPKILPRVAVLKPLRGRSPALEANLVSYLENDYSRAEFYFAVDSYEDPAVEVPVALRARYQFVPITLIVGGEYGCLNRKIGKVIRMAERAERAEIYVMSDADVAVPRDHLRRLVGELSADDRVGLISCIYRSQPSRAIASRLEALSVNTDFAPQVMVSIAIEPTRYALGATIAIKRAALEAIGGFHAVKDQLADDYFLGKMVSDAGWKVRISNAVVTTTCENQHFSDFWNRQIRWARTYRTTRPASLATIIIHGPFWALLLLVVSGFSICSMYVLAAILLARILMARFLTAGVLKVRESASDAWLTPIKDLIITVIWFAGLFGNRITWAGRRLRITRGGIIQELNG